MWIRAINFQKFFWEKIGRESLIFVVFQEGDPKQCALIYFMVSLASESISLCKLNNSSGFTETNSSLKCFLHLLTGFLNFLILHCLSRSESSCPHATTALGSSWLWSYSGDCLCCWALRGWWLCKESQTASQPGAYFLRCFLHRGLELI